jgi:uncharacterized membrane protein YhaH (DUF805 family)
MDAFGINTGYLLIQCALPAVWLLLSFLALIQLRQRSLPETAQAIWVVFIVVVPFLGALAYLIVQPGSSEKP